MIRLFSGIYKRLQKRTIGFQLSQYLSSLNDCQNKKYILSQFPYPSGQLHLGHARVYYIGDTLSKYYKLQGYKVIYPIGFDSFGLPAQNAAIVHKKNPKVWTQNNINQMKQQLNSLNIDFDWEKQFSTHTPQYYKWTQLIFLKMLEKGLAFKAQSEVNWDPIDKTVLANQQVDDLGRSWRSGAIVQKKMLSQWFFKITQYAQQLQNNLTNIQWIQRVKSMQAGWIGFQRGYEIQFQIDSKNELVLKKLQEKEKNILQAFKSQKIKVFLKNKNALKGQYYIRYNQQSNKSQNQNEVAAQQGSIILGYAKDLNYQNKIPIILGNQQNGIRFQLVLKQQNSKNNFDQKGELNLGQKTVMRIKDWSISRQRYWGTPIPIIYCKVCGIMPVPESDLPVILPEWKGQTNPLLSDSFRKCKCPKCGANAERETDTMDTFVDSSWYYLRFLDPKNDVKICNKQLADFWMPVDIYIGGIQHAIMHLLYARFIMRTLCDMNISKIKQPFKELVVQGLVKGKTIRHKITGKYLKADQVSNYDKNQLEQTYQKMSKSKFNGLNPQTLVEKYGPDALRIAIFFASPPENDIDFHQDLLVSADRFLKRVEQTHKNIYQVTKQYKSLSEQQIKQKLLQISQKIQLFNIKRIIVKLQQGIQKRQMHVYIANTMQLYNQVKSLQKYLRSQSNSEIKEYLYFIFQHILVPVLSIIAPTTMNKIFKSFKISQIVWPRSQYFINRKQYLIMKGNKLIKRGLIEYDEETGISNEEIKLKLKLSAETTIKNNKKNIIILIK